MRNFVVFLYSMAIVSLIPLYSQTEFFAQKPYEVVPGFYYFTDQGLYRDAPKAGQAPLFGETLEPVSGIDFKNKLVFTFDDVVFDSYLDSLLALLAQYRIRAVFFLTATHMAATDHAIVSRYLHRFVSEGHQLGNHSYSHDTLDRGRFAAGRNAFEATKKEFTSLEELVDRRLGYHYPMEYIRPPFGIRGNAGRTVGERMSLPGRVDEVCRALGKKLILWHINSVDFLMAYERTNPEYRNAEQVAQETLARIRTSKGGVLLFHANKRTPALVERILKDLWGTQESAYQVATVADLLKMKYGTP